MPYMALVKKILKCTLALMLVGLYAPSAYALSLIRDAETEKLIRDYSDPIFRAANLDPSTIRIFIVNDSSINAFVAGGANMFIHTGLITAADDPNMLIGVIAHEAGHIAGGHLARGSEALEDAQLTTILSYVLGAAAGLAGGSGQAAAGVISAGHHLTTRNFLSFTRINEQAADQAALDYLDETNVPATGLLSLMEKLRAREQIYRGQVDPYALTHPLSKERISNVRAHLLKKSSTKYPEINVTKLREHRRVLGKLKGFLNDPQITLNNAISNSEEDRIAVIVAHHRLSQTTQALKGVDQFLMSEPKNPYFLELKAQILSESGRHQEALPLIKQARELLPQSALLRTDYAKSIMSQPVINYELAAQELARASELDNTNALTWQLLGQAKAELKQSGQALLAYAEAALLRNEADLARRYASDALEKLSSGSPSLLRAQDLREEAIRLQKKKEEKAST